MMGQLFLPLTPMMGTIPPTDTNDGALFLPLTNDGALFLPLTLMMGHYSSHTDTNDGASSLVSVGGIVSHHW
ncbi:unnamed protein product [Staurois parvus]|uniref:Uncharacterized protein n=1 Tax=Staurois parvus TaxID=386267 RepID=A0ABN9GD53_9NEOB|nr:unnamed protein product [Staurois parvus]